MTERISILGKWGQILNFDFLSDTGPENAKKSKFKI